MDPKPEVQVSIVLQYRRMGDLSVGRIIVIPETGEEGEAAHCLDAFEGISYTKMLTHLAREMRNFPEANAIIMRVDRPGLLPYTLDAGTLHLLRTDPVAAIQSMTFESPPMGVVKVKEDRRPLEVSPIRVANDTLSDALGEEVFIKHRASAVECPGCGLWGVVHTVGLQTFFRCNKRCGGEFSLRIKLSRLWGAVQTEDLLKLPFNRFYLPRPWNDGRNWVTWDELYEKYTAYKAEKEQACSAVRAT
jgi:hypothetical protein